MAKSHGGLNRLSIDMLPEEHKKIKAYAALHEKSMREYVLETLRERIKQEGEEGQLLAMTIEPSPVLKELWDNEKDAAYDEI